MRFKILQVLSGLFEKSVALIAFFTLWEIAPRLNWIDKRYVPPFSQVMDAFIGLIRSGKLFIHISASLQRVFIALLLAVIVGISVGFLIAFTDKIAKILRPVLEFFRNTPTLAIMPVLIIFFGLGEASKISILFYEALWPILIASIDVVKNVDPLSIKVAKSMKASRRELIIKVIIPSSIPNIITAFRLSATNTMLVLMVAEVMGGFKGIGLFIKTSGGKNMYAGVITIALIGVILNFIFVRFENYLTGWKENGGE